MSPKSEYLDYWWKPPILARGVLYVTGIFSEKFQNTVLHFNVQCLITYQRQKWESLVRFGSWEYWSATRTACRPTEPEKTSKNSVHSQFAGRNTGHRTFRLIWLEVAQEHKIVASISPVDFYCLSGHYCKPWPVPDVRKCDPWLTKPSVSKIPK